MAGLQLVRERNAENNSLKIAGRHEASKRCLNSPFGQNESGRIAQKPSGGESAQRASVSPQGVEPIIAFEDRRCYNARQL